MTPQTLETLFAQFETASVEETKTLIAQYGLDFYCAWLDQKISQRLVSPELLAKWASQPNTERVQA